MSAFDFIFEQYGPDVAPFMHRMRQEWADSQPVKGLSLVHNIPLTATTLLKLACLRAGGADLLVTSFSFCEPAPVALETLAEVGIPFERVQDIKGDFDVVLDCGAELMATCRGRLGAVELTRSGAIAYERSEPDYPVVSVDDTRLKQLETCLGTGEGVYRAICDLASRDLAGADLVLFGFGKVGRGIAHYFKETVGRITVVEMLSDRLQVAEDRGFETVSASHKNEVEALVARADVVVTATGRGGVISDYYDPASFRQGAILANAGAEDEFGAAFSAKDVLFEKGPVNFSQDEPTRMQFLDPIFYAHNLAVLDLLDRPAPGFYPLNKAADDLVMAQWCAHHGRTEAALQTIFGP